MLRRVLRAGGAGLRLRLWRLRLWRSARRHDHDARPNRHDAVRVEGGEGGALRREVRAEGVVQRVQRRRGGLQQRVRPEEYGRLRVVRARRRQVQAGRRGVVPLRAEAPPAAAAAAVTAVASAAVAAAAAHAAAAFALAPAAPAVRVEGGEGAVTARAWGEKEWCSKYNDTRQCANAYAQKARRYGWCEHDGGKARSSATRCAPVYRGRRAPRRRRPHPRPRRRRRRPAAASIAAAEPEP